MSGEAARVGRFHQALLLGAIGVGSLVILPGFPEPVMLPKATVIVVGAVLMLAVAAFRMLMQGRLLWPVSLPLLALGALLGTMTVVTLTAGDQGTSLVGRYSRYGGLAQYAAYAVLLGSLAVLYRRRAITSLTQTLLFSLTVVLAYGSVQLAEADPILWRSGLDEPLFSTMGNTNYASAYTGILVPLALSVVLRSSVRVRWRVVAGLLALLGFVYTLRLEALQGPLIALAGGAVVAAAAMGDPRPRLRRATRWQQALGVGVVLAAVAAGVRLAAFVVSDLPNSLHQRTQLWTAAWRIFLDHPLVGTGLDGYGDHFLAYRPIAHATERGLSIADSAHQVPLGMFANGGIVLGLAYLAFTAVVGMVLVRGLRRADGDERVVLAGYGGAWLAYQVQSLVSIDVPPVALLHFVTAGAVLALAAPPRVVAIGAFPRPVGVRLVAAGLIGLMTLAGLGQVVRPLRADANAGLALQAAQDGDDAEAIASSRRALEFLPFQPSYRRVLGKRLAATDRAAGLQELQRAAEDEAGNISYVLDVIRLAERLDEQGVVDRWNDELLRRDPYNVGFLLAQAGRERAGGDPTVATSLLERAIRVQPRDRRAYQDLAALHTFEGDQAAARRTYERLLRARPGDSVALQMLGADDEQG